MSIYESTIAKIRDLPEPLIQEVNDFIDLLQMKGDSTRYQLWILFKEALDISESDFGDYLSNLEDYEDRLARGEIKCK
jgi:hypothetical protein